MIDNKRLSALCFSVLQNLVVRVKLIFCKRNALNLFRRALKQNEVTQTLKNDSLKKSLMYSYRLRWLLEFTIL